MVSFERKDKNFTSAVINHIINNQIDSHCNKIQRKKGKPLIKIEEGISRNLISSSLVIVYTKKESNFSFVRILLHFFLLPILFHRINIAHVATTIINFNLTLSTFIYIPRQTVVRLFSNIWIVSHDKKDLLIKWK